MFIEESQRMPREFKASLNCSLNCASGTNCRSATFSPPHPPVSQPVQPDLATVRLQIAFSGTNSITMDANLLIGAHTDSLLFQSPPPPPNSQLPPYGFPDQHDADVGTTTPPSAGKSKRRKLSAYNDGLIGDDAEGDLDDSLQRNGSRKSRPAGTKRACNQCRQQKV
jgi:hypothetical protein